MEQVSGIPPTYSQASIPNGRPHFHMSVLLTRVAYRILGIMEALSQCQAAIEETTSNKPQGQITTQDAFPKMRTAACPSSVAAETAEIQVAQRAVHCRILAPSETLMVGGIITIILMIPGVPTIILKLAMILAGILVLARTRTGTQTLAAALASEEIETLD